MALGSEISQAFNSIQTLPLTPLSKAIGIATDPIILLILAIIISAILFYKKQKSYAILIFTTSILSAAIIKTLKTLINSPRPLNALVLETNSSFPSGHTTFAIIFFGLLVYIFAKTPKQKYIGTILATFATITIILSRLQLQVHYPLDIFAGIILGSIILTASILIHKKFLRKKF